MNYIRNIIAKIFKTGAEIPKSVAIIMDGNRRFAKSKNIEKIQGHESGLTTLLSVLNWSIELNIKELTVFAFSIDNFNRPKDEYENLMDLAKNKFKKLAGKNEYFNLNGVKVCFFGNLNYIDIELKEIIEKLENETKTNDKIKLNICFSYNSTEELYQAKEKTIKKLSKINNKTNNLIEENQIINENSSTQIIFESFLYGGYNCRPDILIRTSGEVRLSNFLVYQLRFSSLFFIDKMWPDFGFFDLISIILKYNLGYKDNLERLKLLEANNNFNILRS